MLFEPLHNTKPDGMAFAAPDHIKIQPEGTATIPVKFAPEPAKDVAVTTPLVITPPELTVTAAPTFTSPPETFTPLLAVITPTESTLVTSSYVNTHLYLNYQ